MEDEEGAIIFLDQQKAFDRVEWEWIDLCFEKFGFRYPVIIYSPEKYSYPLRTPFGRY
jgi:hypothetical protein